MEEHVISKLGRSFIRPFSSSEIHSYYFMTNAYTASIWIQICGL
jgi:hypothetical protein